MRILLPALSFWESRLNPRVCLCVHIHVLASCTCGFSLDSQQATFCFLCHSPQHLPHCVHRLAGWLNPQACKGGEQSFRNPQRHLTENKYNQGSSSSLAGEVTPSVGFPHPLQETDGLLSTCQLGEWVEVTFPKPFLPPSTYLIKGTLHLLHHLALVFTGQKSML